MEAFGKDLKLSKYYYCVTFFIYEFIWILSILLYIYTLDMNSWSIEGRLRALKKIPFKTALVFLAEFILLITNKPSICSHWIRNSIVHISLCRYKILAVSWLENYTHKMFYFIVYAIHKMRFYHL